MTEQLTAGRYRELLALARRCARGRIEPGDLLNEALAAALAAGRPAAQLGEAWLAGVMRNLSLMHARTAARRRLREGRFASSAPDEAVPPAPPALEALEGLSPALRVVALLALSGHDRTEIRHLLRITDVALRQRIAGVRRHLARAGAHLPEGLPGLGGALPYGRIRRGLLPLARAGAAFLATHDPDGHPLAFGFVHASDSRNAARRQPVTASNQTE